MAKITLSPAQIAFEKTLSEAGKEIFKDVKSTAEGMDTVEAFAKELPEEYTVKDAETLDEALDIILDQVDWSTHAPKEYEKFKKDFVKEEKQKDKEKKEKAAEKGKDASKKSDTKKSGAKKESGKSQDVRKAETKDTVLNHVMELLLKAKAPIWVGELQKSVQKNCNIGMGTSYRVITDYAKVKTSKIEGVVIASGKKGYQIKK